MNLWRNAIFRYLCYGVLFGALFPITATIFDIRLRGLPVALSAALAVQSTQPLHWMIDTAPLFLGLFATLIGWRQERLEQALRRAERAEEIARLNADNARLYEQTRRQLVELQELQQNLAGAARTIRTLTVPLIPVGHEVMALPLLGVFDGPRIADLRAATLRGIHDRRARVVILDCTGVEAMTDEAVRELALAIDALLLIGAQTLICGVGAALARQLAANQIDRRAHHIAIDLEHAIAFALAQRTDVEHP